VGKRSGELRQRALHLQAVKVKTEYRQNDETLGGQLERGAVKKKRFHIFLDETLVVTQNQEKTKERLL